ncbi:MAG TPA: serine hydrolase domain-containing protein [Telluria sp.]|nr:serine hydrolase domain-containing protein [Telluria sp.]
MKLLLCAAAVSFAMPVLAAPPLPAAAPQAVGISAERLERLDSFMRGVTERGEYLGAVILVARSGKIVDYRAYGYRDLARHDKLARDAIFRIYSMTKTVTAAAVLTLMEEGKLTLDDPIGKHLPEFADMVVLTGGTADAPQTRPVKNPITIRQLLTHTPGFAVYGKPTDAVNILFDRAALSASPDLKEYARRLARLPLAHEPGEQFHYDGVPTQLLARLVEVLSGMPFDRYLQTRIFSPLGMADTGFSVPPAKRARIADMTTTDRDGKLAPPAPGMVAAAGEQLNPYFSGAGGLYSTAADYARFAQMLLNGGQLDGASILGRKTVELMMQNHLTQLNPPVTEFSPAEGFGLGGSVLLDVARRGRLGSAGAFGWSGAASTYYTVDPKEQLVAILMMQHLPQGLPNDPPKLSVKFYNLVYQALVK